MFLREVPPSFSPLISAASFSDASARTEQNWSQGGVKNHHAFSPSPPAHQVALAEALCPGSEAHSHFLCISPLPAPSQLQPPSVLHSSPLFSLLSVSLGRPLHPTAQPPRLSVMEPTEPNQPVSMGASISPSDLQPVELLVLPASLPNPFTLQPPKTPVRCSGEIALLSEGDLKSIPF